MRPLNLILPFLMIPMSLSAVPVTFDESGSGCVDVIVAYEHHGAADLQLTAFAVLTGSDSVSGIHDAHLIPGNRRTKLSGFIDASSTGDQSANIRILNMEH